MSDPKKIQSILRRHPEIQTVEDVLAQCNAEGVNAGLWSVYFAARDMSRQLTRRRTPAPRESDIRDLALVLIGLHKGARDALATMDVLQKMTDSRTRIDWQSETTNAVSAWELSVAQELAELAGGISQAKIVIAEL